MRGSHTTAPNQEDCPETGSIGQARSGLAQAELETQPGPEPGSAPMPRRLRQLPPPGRAQRRISGEDAQFESSNLVKSLSTACRKHRHPVPRPPTCLALNLNND